MQRPHTPVRASMSSVTMSAPRRDRDGLPLRRRAGGGRRPPLHTRRRRGRHRRVATAVGRTTAACPPDDGRRGRRPNRRRRPRTPRGDGLRGRDGRPPLPVEPANGIANSVHHYFVARGCEPSADQNLDFNESIRPTTVDYDDWSSRCATARSGRSVWRGITYYAPSSAN